jgi:predicted NUDIX family NTP pyrophosphohydrolase
MNNALEYAERFESVKDWYEFDAQSWFPLAAAELRRQAARIEELESVLRQAHDTLRQAGLDDSRRNYQMEADCSKLIKEALK